MNDILKKLINNAFDFLEKSIDQVDNEPKFSVINFCIATELFLKARLMNEHWSLIVSKDPDIQKFEKGDFKTIAFYEIISKIENITGERIDEKAKKCFQMLANHRNKVVHFYSDDYKTNATIVSQIAIEHYNGWHFLSILIDRWKLIFEPFDDRISDIKRKMMKYESYLQIVYNNIKLDIEKSVKRGVKFKKCSSCKQLASEVSRLTEHLYVCTCKVCRNHEQYIELECPDDNCNGNIKIDGYNVGFSEFTCDKCSEDVDMEFITGKLDHNQVTDEYYTRINCGECSTPGDVVKDGDYYICLSCLTTDTKYGICEWCGEGELGGRDMQFSGVTGCSFCDGSREWSRDN